MPHVENIQSNNYTLLKIIRSSISPLSGMIGISAYYGQLIGNPSVGSNSVTKTLLTIQSLINVLISSSLAPIWFSLTTIRGELIIQSIIIYSKAVSNAFILSIEYAQSAFSLGKLGHGTIGLANYSKFTNSSINPNPTENPIITTTVDPFPPDLLLSTSDTTDNHLMDWDTYISLNAYGISNLIAGLTELIPYRFETIRKIANMGTGGCLISSGVAMGINNDFNNAYAVPTIIAGASEIIHNLLPMETSHHIEEMQETPFNNETARLINDNRFTINSETTSQYGSDNMSEVPLNWDYSHMSL